METPDIREYMIRALWGPREESIEECTRRICAFFEAAKTKVPDISLVLWKKRGKSKKQALAFPEQDFSQKETVQALLKLDPVFKDLGFKIGGWNESSNSKMLDEDEGIDITIGQWSKVSPNLFLMKIFLTPLQAIQFLPVITVEAQRAFAPDECLAIESKLFHEHYGEYRSGGNLANLVKHCEVGYFSSDRARTVELDETVLAKKIVRKSEGVFVVSEEVLDRFSAVLNG